MDVDGVDGDNDTATANIDAAVVTVSTTLDSNDVILPSATRTTVPTTTTDAGTSITNTASSNDEEKSFVVSTLIDLDEIEEISATIRRDQVKEEARIEHEKEQALERSAVMAKEQQQQLKQRKMQHQYGIIIGVVVLILMVVIVIAVVLVVSGNKSRTPSTPITAPTSSIEDKQWKVACDFVSISSLSQCQ